MSIYSKSLLSQSSNGKPLLITGTGTGITSVHTGPTSVEDFDEIWLYACNPTSSDHMLNVVMGGNDFTSDVIFNGVIEAYAGNVLICPGFVINGNGTSGINIGANVSTPSGVNLMGYVNQIS